MDKVLPGLEPGLKESESLVMTNYTIGPGAHDVLFTTVHGNISLSEK